MQQRISSFGVLSAAVGLILLLGHAAGLAQQQPQFAPAPFLQVTTVEVKATFDTDYEEYRTQLLTARNKMNTPGYFQVYSVWSGGSTGMYVILTPYRTFADMDAAPNNAEVLRNAFGDAEAERLAKLRAGVERVTAQLFREIPTLHTKPRTFNPPTSFLHVVRTEVKPGLNTSYQSYLDRLKAAEEKRAAAPTVLRLGSSTGTPFTYVAIRPFNTHAERDAWPAGAEALLLAEYGEAEARKLLDAQAQSIARRDTWILRYRSELSRPAAPTTTSD